MTNEPWEPPGSDPGQRPPLTPEEAKEGRRGLLVMGASFVGLIIVGLVWFGTGPHGDDPASAAQPLAAPSSAITTSAAAPSSAAPTTPPVVPTTKRTTIGSHRAVPAPKRTTRRATPKPTHRPTPAPTHRPAPKPKPKPKPAPPLVVHPGAFCSDPKATGVSPRGVPMRCKTTAKDDRLRWRHA